MENKVFHISVAAVLVALLMLLTDPFMYWMPAGVQMLVLLGATALAALWAGFVMQERAHDEREAVHTMYAGRAAYLSGLAVLTLALIVQGLAHAIDPWVPLALGAMVVSKLAARMYVERRQ